MNIEHRPWKIKFDLGQNSPTAVLETLYDLMYDTDGNVRYFKSSPDGFNLKHDVICFDPSIYDESYKPTQEKFSQWEATGIDVCPAFFDSRARALLLASTATDSSITKDFVWDSGIYQDFKPEQQISKNDADLDTLFAKVITDSKTLLNTFNTDASNLKAELEFRRMGHTPSVTEALRGTFVYDQDAAIFPATTAEVMKHSVQATYDNVAMNTFYNQYENPYRVVPADMLSALTIPDIVLVNRDTVFDATLQSKNMMGYVGMCFNPQSVLIRNLFIEAMNLNPNQFANNDWVYALKDSLFLTWLAKHTYIWIRCMFWADYVNPNDFLQDLDTQADVKHGNVLITDTADFRRYDDSLESSKTIDKYSSENSRSYVPKTAPIIDFVTEPLLKKAFTTDFTTNWKTMMETLVARASIPGSIIGSINGAEPVSRSSDENSLYSFNDLTPPMFFDPESRKPVVNQIADKYTYAYVPGNNVIPSVIPKRGNLIVDGRIESPAIDELWVFLKKLVFGRAKDADKNTTNNSVGYGSSTVTLTNAIDNNKTYEVTRETKKDTRVPSKEINFWNFDDISSKLVQGDPISHEIVIRGSNSILNVDDWVNSPDTVVYRIFDSILDLDQTVVGYKDAKYTGSGIPEFANRTIMNFTAKLKADKRYQEKVGADTDRSNEASGIIRSSTDTDTKNGIINNNTIATANPPTAAPVSSDIEWKIREQPYSLRELEVYVKSLRYNIETLANYLVHNFATNGRLGRTDSTSDAAGSLYQLHADYNGEINELSTVFSDVATTPQSRRPKFTTDTNAAFNANTITGVRIEHYGTELKDRGNSYSAQDVYLAADGQWRYIFDAIRFPITRSEF
jgi:hypothetical protein